jgi:hypothetical protein
MTLFHELTGRARRWSGRSASIALAVWIALGAVAIVAAQSSDLQTPSPAQGNAQVIAQGMTNRPALASVWRVVEREIPVRADARPSDRLEGSAGFLLANDDAIFITDQDSKQRYRLAPGEAEFVPIGANQTWASLDDRATTAYTVELAVMETADESTADGEVIYRGSDFGMTEGDYDLDLVRDVLPPQDETNIDATAFPILIFVTEGQITVTTESRREPVRLRAGEGGTFEGDLDIATRGDNQAVFVAGVVSASIGGSRTEPEETPTPEPTAEPTQEPTEEPTAEPTEEPTEEPTAEPEEEETEEATEAPEEQEEEPTSTPVPESRTGSAELRLSIRLCPAGMTPEEFDAESCARANGDWSVALVTPYGDTLRLREANRVTDDYIRWSDLKAGDYELLVRQAPEGYEPHSLDGYLCCTDGGGYTIRLSPGLSVVGTIYFFPES